jgi:preprotein translocase SecF subunit
MIGILTSVFAALVTTRVFVHFALARGGKDFKMGRWLADASYDYISKTKIAAVLSTVVCVGGLIAFALLDREEKLGIDFTGGAEAQIVTAEPQTVDFLRERVGRIQDIGSSAEVKTVLNSEQESGRFTQFRLQFKSLVEEGQDLTIELRPIVERELADILLASPIQVALRSDGDATRADVGLYFQEMPPTAEVQAALESAGLKEVSVQPGERLGAFTATATTSSGRDLDELRLALDAALRPLVAGGYELSQPIQSFTQVGPQVVGELRDKALLALAVSLFVTVLYIRVRFAEYSYGVAAMVAVLHDVLFTLAALAIGNHFGIVNGEINLAMIAVFLTIIGYSVNDTIVIFDRVRENLPKSSAPLRDVLNKSINETMSRTIMTSLTVFLAIIVQYVFNVGTGNLLESISFALIFGTLSGVYSTVFIANPVFLWLETRSQKKKTSGGAQARARREEERRRLERARQDSEGEDVTAERV